MDITNCSKVDFDQILTDFGQFWEHDRTLALHHPTLLYSGPGKDRIVFIKDIGRASHGN
jgi:hypothetical protein